MHYISKKFILKIPHYIEMYYCTNRHLIIFRNFPIYKSLKIKTQLLINKNQKFLKVTCKPLYEMSNNEKKRLKSMQTTQVVLLKQLITDIAFASCKKIKLVGVGFRVSSLKVSSIELLKFKLGYSHAVYFKIPKTLNIFCLKPNKLVIIGNSFLFLSQVAAIIRSYKAPEPYKGKGVVYTSEKIILKEGKKI